MGPISVPVPGNQFRPPLPEINPNVRKNDTTEKRKRATPKKFRPTTPKITATCPPLPEAPPKPKNNTPSVPIREDTPWPSAGKMSEISSRTETGYFLKTVWLLRIRMRV